MLMILLCISLSFFFIITGTLGTVSCCLRCCFYELLYNRMLTELHVREIPVSYIVSLGVAEN
jgi:hypothetical protein